MSSRKDFTGGFIISAATENQFLLAVFFDLSVTVGL
jgi:hypothetical protein